MKMDIFTPPRGGTVLNCSVTKHFIMAGHPCFRNAQRIWNIVVRLEVFTAVQMDVVRSSVSQHYTMQQPRLRGIAWNIL